MALASQDASASGRMHVGASAIGLGREEGREVPWGPAETQRGCHGPTSPKPTCNPNPTWNVHRPLPAFGAEIGKSICRLVKQHTPIFACIRNYHSPIHGARRAPVRNSLPTSNARNPRDKIHSLRSRRWRVDCPVAAPSRTAETLRSPAIFTVTPLSFDVASI